MSRWLFLGWVLTLALAAAAGYLGFARPDLLQDPVPIHWDINLQPDGFVPADQAWWALLLSPALMALVLLLAHVLPWLSPRHFEVDGFRGTFDGILFLIVVFFGYIGGLLMWASLRGHELPGGLFVGGFFALFTVLGLVIGRVRRNFWMGVRTPWTLASETVWDRTHKLTSRLWPIAGLVGLVSLALGVPLVFCFVTLMLAVLAPAIYSLVLYKVLQGRGQV